MDAVNRLASAFCVAGTEFDSGDVVEMSRVLVCPHLALGIVELFGWAC
jgi:hypothetical protein